MSRAAPLLCAALVAAFLFSGCARRFPPEPPPRVVWITGLFGERFSRGIIAMAQARGEPHVPHNADLALVPGTVAIVGHSLGADTACRLAQQYTQAGLKLRAVVLLDPTRPCVLSGQPLTVFWSARWDRVAVPGAREIAAGGGHVRLPANRAVQAEINRLIGG